MKNYKDNLELLSKNYVYSHEMEHDACGVGLIASTEGKKSRAVVEHGIEALKRVWILVDFQQMEKTVKDDENN